MSKKTKNLDLFEYDPITDGSSTFNVDEALNKNWEIIDEAVDGKASKSTIVDATLLSSSWVGNEYELSVEGVTETSIQELLPSLSITEDELSALQSANIIDNGQEENIIKLKAIGDVPTSNIPIRVIVRGDM